MKKSTVGLVSFLFITTTVVLAYNACSVRRFEVPPGTSQNNLSSTTPPVTIPTNTVSDTKYLVQTGVLKLTAAGQALNLPMSGRILMARNMDSQKSDVYVHVSGFAASTKFDSHVHNLPCSVNSGGGHYKIDNSVAAAVENNEVWPAFTTGVDGTGAGFVSSSHMVRPEGQSIVVHAADGSRIACGNFNAQVSAYQKSGRFAVLPAGTAAGRSISGAAVLIRNAGANQTVVKARVAGLTPNTTYMAHVHNQACATGEGGAHYKMNSSVTEVAPSTANELWLTFAANAAGYAEARVEAEHVARPDALSIVIHDPVTPTNRLACVDLSVDGGFLSTEVGLQKLRNIIGNGKIERLANGDTQVTVSASGLLPNTSYIPHVHDRPCHINAGGGHYKIDYSIAAAVETNEIWPRFVTDATGLGTGSVTVRHLARPEAQSIVLHDPVDAARIACMDIY